MLVTYLAGNENAWIAIPDTVMESLLSASCEPREVVHQLKLSLQWDQASLEDPTPENKRLIRYLATKAKHSNRLDVVKHLREITPAGTAGELQESCIVLFSRSNRGVVLRALSLGRFRRYDFCLRQSCATGIRRYFRLSTRAQFSLTTSTCVARMSCV